MFPKKDATKLLAKHCNEKCKQVQMPFPGYFDRIQVFPMAKATARTSSQVAESRNGCLVMTRAVNKCHIICQIVNASLFSKSICQCEIRVVQLVILKCLSTCYANNHDTIVYVWLILLLDDTSEQYYCTEMVYDMFCSAIAS